MVNLIAYTDLQTTRNNSLKTSLTHSLQLFDTTSVPSPRIPAELLDRIVELAIPLCDLTASPIAFAEIASFSLASRSFRYIALRRYFRDMILHSFSHWKNLFDVLQAEDARSGGNGGFTWVRTLWTASKSIVFEPARLGSLTHLQELSISFENEGLSTQNPVFKLFCQHLLSSALDNASHKLTCLTLTSLPRIDTSILRLIARSFPCLLDLYLSCTERLDFASCCWGCAIDSLECTIHSPIPGIFLDENALASNFADALKPLKNLTHLHLGIYLSDEQLVYSHLDHAEDDYYGGIAYGPDECDICDEHTRKVRDRELAASIVLAQKLKSLKSIGWSSFFIYTQDLEEIGAELERVEAAQDHEKDVSVCHSRMQNGRPRSTKVWVLRKNGRVRARRTAW